MLVKPKCGLSVLLHSYSKKSTYLKMNLGKFHQKLMSTRVCVGYEFASVNVCVVI